jgi:hypothetical protein
MANLHSRNERREDHRDDRQDRREDHRDDRHDRKDDNRDDRDYYKAPPGGVYLPPAPRPPRR